MIYVIINSTLLACLEILIKGKFGDFNKFSKKAGRLESEKVNARIKVFWLPIYFFIMNKKKYTSKKINL